MVENQEVDGLGCNPDMRMFLDVAPVFESYLFLLYY